MKLNLIQAAVILFHVVIYSNNGLYSQPKNLPQNAHEYLEQGKKHFDNLDYDRAYVSLKKAIEIDSTLSMAYFWLADLTVQDWNIEPKGNGGEFIRKAFGYRDKLAEPSKFLVKAYFTYWKEGYNAGLKILEEFEKNNPQNELMLLGMAHWSLNNYTSGNLNRSKEYFYKLLSIRPDYPRAHLGLINAFEELAEYDSMLISAHRLFDLHPNILISVTLAHAYIRAKKVQQGWDFFSDKLNNAQENDGFKASLAILSFHLNKKQEKNPTVYQINNLRALEEAAWILYNQGEFEESEKFFLKVHEIDPNRPGTLNGLGWLYLAQNEFASSEEYFTKGNLLSPFEPNILFGLGRSFLMQMKYDEAKSCFEKLKITYPAISIVEEDLGLIALTQKQYIVAEEYFYKATNLNSSSYRGFGSLAYLNVEKQSYEKALSFAQKTMKLDTGFQAINLMAWVLVSGKINLDKGLTLAQESLKRKPDWWSSIVEVYPFMAMPEYSLGLAYFNKGDYPKAIEFLENAKELYPAKESLDLDLKKARKMIGE